jgi:hypothetical protein
MTSRRLADREQNQRAEDRIRQQEWDLQSTKLSGLVKALYKERLALGYVEEYNSRCVEERIHFEGWARGLSASDQSIIRKHRPEMATNRFSGRPGDRSRDVLPPRNVQKAAAITDDMLKVLYDEHASYGKSTRSAASSYASQVAAPAAAPPAACSVAGNRAHPNHRWNGVHNSVVADELMLFGVDKDPGFCVTNLRNGTNGAKSHGAGLVWKERWHNSGLEGNGFPGMGDARAGKIFDMIRARPEHRQQVQQQQQQGQQGQQQQGVQQQQWHEQQQQLGQQGQGQQVQQLQPQQLGQQEQGEQVQQQQWQDQVQQQWQDQAQQQWQVLPPWEEDVLPQWEEEQQQQGHEGQGQQQQVQSPALTHIDPSGNGNIGATGAEGPTKKPRLRR